MSTITTTSVPERPIELVALDIAGTTVEEHGAVYDALHAAVAEAGSTAGAADVQHWMGAEKSAAIRALLTLRDPRRRNAIDVNSTGDVIDDTVARTFARFTELLAAAYAARPPQPLPGVPRAFATLRASGIAVALTTGFTREVADGILASLGWTVASGPADRLSPDVTLDAVVAADEVPTGRPAPHMVHRAMERTGVVDVRAVLTAGDTVLDLRAGRRAGAGVVVGVLTGRLGATREGVSLMRAEPHDVLLDSVADLPELLINNGGSKCLD